MDAVIYRTKRALSKLTIAGGAMIGWLVVMLLMLGVMQCVTGDGLVCGLGFKMESCGGVVLQKE